MSVHTRRELIWATASRYRIADRVGRSKILDEFCATTGYNRKYACGILTTPPVKRLKPLKRNRSSQFSSADVKSLKEIWEVSGRLCGKRLVFAMPKLVEALLRHDELTISSERQRRLLSASASTLDRLLAATKHSLGWKGKTTTKPGTLLKHQIKVRTFADWDDARPGFFEADLVAHCGETAAGDFAYTLTMTDVNTGWTETISLANKGQMAVCDGIEKVRKRLPFKMLGIDSDNGTEFINFHLLRYCKKHKITFTRSRPYKKNDQCHVESKNWSVVRTNTGYLRFEGEGAVRKLEALHSWLRLHVNYFQPSQKLLSKKREGAKLSRKHDEAKTPYQRLLDTNTLSSYAKKDLEELYNGLNPAELNRQLIAARQNLTDCAKVRILNEATNSTGSGS